MKFNILLTIICGFLLYSCSEILPEEKEYPYDFKDQLVQGEAYGNPFIYVDGRAESGSQLLSVELFDIPIYDTIPRDPKKPEGDSIVVAIHDTIIDATYGAKMRIDIPLDFEIHNLSEWNCRVIYTKRDSADEHMSDGAVQLTSIGEDSVKGRIDVISGTEVFFNGHFIVPVK